MPNPPILDLSTSGRFDIVGVYKDMSWPTVEIFQWTDDTFTVPVNFPTGVYHMEIFVDKEFANRVMEILSPGIVVVTNKITVTRTISQNTLNPGVHHYRVWVLIDVDTARQLLHGTLTVNP